MNFQSGHTTTTVTETHVQTNLRWDPGYIVTVPGILKGTVVILDLVGFICVMCSGAYWRSTSTGEWFAFVAMTGFWTTLTLLLFYLLHVIEKFHVIPWMLIELIYCALWSFFCLTASIDAAVNAAYEKAFGAAAFFGFAATGVYAYDAFIKFKGWKAGQLAQGERTVQQSSAEVASPAY